MAKTVFTAGTVVTSVWANSVNNPQFDGQDLDGHRGKILDAELSDTGIKATVFSISNALKVEATGSGTGLTVEAGTYHDASGLLEVFAGDSMTLPANGDHFVFFDSNNVLSDATVLPSVYLPLARVVTSAGEVVGSVVDLRPRYSMSPRPITVPVIGGYGTQQALVVRPTGTPGWDVSNTIFTVIADVNTPYILQGQRDLSALTIMSGAFVVSGGATLKVSGDVNIEGTFTVLPKVNGGPGYAGSMYIPGDILTSAGSGLGGSGGHSAAPEPYSYHVSQTGSGGGSAFTKGRLTGSAVFANMSDAAQITTGRGGKGGSFLKIEAGGEITISGAIYVDGEDATDSVYTSGIGTNQFILGSGAGGGSGGLIHLVSVRKITLTPTSELFVRGGAGGSGHITAAQLGSYIAVGGGGGGGGHVVLHAPVMANSSVSIDLGGGLAGTDVGTGSNSLSGCPGASYSGTGGQSGQNGEWGDITTLVFSP